MMKKHLFVISLFVAAAFLSGCSSTKPSEENAKSVVSENSASSNQSGPSEVRMQVPAQDAKVNEEPVAEPRVWPDGSEWAKETQIVVKSDEDLNKLRELCDEAAKSANSEHVLAPVHAIVPVDSVDALNHAMELFADFGKDVSTFELQFTAPVDQHELDIPLKMDDVEHSRIIVSGQGSTPIAVNMLRFDIQSDVVQIRNLNWGGGDIGFSRLNVHAGRLFEIKDARFEHIFADADTNPDVAPLVVVASDTQGDDVTLVRFDHVAFKENNTLSLFTMDNSERIAALRLDSVVIENNVTNQFGLEISAKERVEVSDCTIRGNKATAALVQKSPFAQVTIQNSQLADKVYTYRPLPKYMRQSPRALVLENNDVAEGTVLK